MPLGYVILSKVVPCPLLSCFHEPAFPEPCLDPQCCLYNLLEGQPENSWPLKEKCWIIFNLSRYSALHLPCFLQHVQQQHLSVNLLGRLTGTQCLLGVRPLAPLQGHWACRNSLPPWELALQAVWAQTPTTLLLKL